MRIFRSLTAKREEVDKLLGLELGAEVSDESPSFILLPCQRKKQPAGMGKAASRAEEDRHKFL
ncbi:hypothetical protein [Cohnella panacarvi]|uniref:hypothetical protein n=1 Tax=Cohnella panacarvi TaxID=400776 RepID=UPI00047CEF30|nr:hypothetical protein [Cohnella panacarvi]